MTNRLKAWTVADVLAESPCLSPGKRGMSNYDVNQCRGLWYELPRAATMVKAIAFLLRDAANDDAKED